MRVEAVAPGRVAAGREARAPALLAVVAGAWVVGWLAAGCWWNRHAGWAMVPFAALVLVESAVAVVVGWLVVRRLPRHPVGWLLLAHGAFVVMVLSGNDQPGSSQLSALATQLGQGAWVLLYVSLAMIGFLFPTGHFVSRRWRRFAIGCLVGYAAFLVAAGFDSSSFAQEYPGVAPPLSAFPQWLVGTVGFAGLAAVAASLVGAVASSWVRLRRSTGEERRQMLWFVWAALSIPGGLALCWLDYWLTGGAGVLTFLGVTVTGSVLPLAIGVAILRSRLFDIQLVLSRTLVYGALTVGVVGLYAAVVGVARAVLDRQGLAGLLAVGLVAVAIQPVHAWLRRRVERWVYGDRSDPYAALQRLSGRLESTESAAEVLATVRACVAEALRVDVVRIELTGEADDVTAGRPSAPGPVERAPLLHRGELLGDLVVEVPPGRSFTASDRQVLDDLARQAAVAVDAVRLTLDLQRSRARLVTAREEERRRLRRDLHDGLGPSLAAMVLKLNAVSGHVSEPTAQELLGQLRAETRAAIDEIRRLVDDLRPPALDEVGLVGALRQRAAALTGDQAGGTRFVVEGPTDTAPLPAAVEVAAYRIAVEAMTNVLRHARATRCTVTIEVDGAVEVAVLDNGDGARWVDGAGDGVGMGSMRERAAELGGSCTVLRRAEGGTAVRAVIPVSAAMLSPAPVTPPAAVLPEQVGRS